MESEKFPYQKEWEDYKSYKGIGCIFLLIFAIAFPFLREYDFFLRFAPYIFLSAFFLFGIYSLFNDTSWKCPRCKEIFFPRKGLGTWTKDYCIKCNLPKYYGSNYFLDYWGTEKANKLIEENKEQVGMQKEENK